MDTGARHPRGDRGVTQPPRRQRSERAGRGYVVTVVGDVPRNIAERVSAAHASAIGAAGSPVTSAPPRGERQRR